MKKYFLPLFFLITTCVASEKRITANDEQSDQTERIVVKKMLAHLDWTGESNGKKGRRLLLGDILVEKGCIMPQLIRDQTQSVKVVKIEGNRVVYGWLDRKTGFLMGETFAICYQKKFSSLLIASSV